jgi:YHS domain-containing protein
MLRCLTVILLAAGCGGSSSPRPAPPPAAAKVLIATDDDGVALGGHDPVAYRDDGAPVAGLEEHTAEHGGGTYLFASAEHRAAFEADPARFAPAYGGYCAFAVSQGRLTPADPTVWELIDDQLLLFASADFHAQFDADPAAHKRAADANWPALVAEHGSASE